MKKMGCRTGVHRCSKNLWATSKL